MPTILLTELAIKNLASHTQTDFYCSQTPRFGIRVSKTGKTFFVFTEEPRRRLALGKFPSTSLKDARKEAKRLLTNPRSKHASMTFLEAKTTYVETYLKRKYRPRSAKEAERLLTKHTKHLDQRAAKSLTATDFIAIFDKLKPSEANHLFGVARTFFNWCDTRDICENPLRKLDKPYPEKSRNRVLTDAEIKDIWYACPKTNFGSIVRLLILLGTRRGETANLSDDWITDETIIIPPEHTKNGEELVIPLCTNARDTLSGASRGTSLARGNSTLLFPSHKTGKVITGWAKLKGELDKASEVTGWTLHDIRRTFSTIHARIGTPPHIVEMLLNHKTSDTLTPIAKIYNRFRYLDEKRTAMLAYEHEIIRILADEAA